MKGNQMEEFEGGFGAKRFNRLIRHMNKNRVLLDRPGWEATEDGTLPPPTPDEAAAVVNFPWRLTPNESGEAWDLQVGTLLANDSNLETTVTITGDLTDLSPQAGDLLYLEVTERYPTSGTVVLGPAWSDYPNPYSTSGTGAAFDLSHYRFPLWRFYSADGAGRRRKFSDDLYGLHVCNFHLEVLNGVYQDPSEGILNVPKFVHAHRAIPST